MEVRIIRDGRTRIDYERKLLVIRKPRTLDKQRKKEYVYGQEKLDGFRVVFTSLGEVLTTTGCNIADQCKRFAWYDKLPTTGFIDGELIAPGQNAEVIKTILASGVGELEFKAIGISWIATYAELGLLEYEIANYVNIKTPRWWHCGVGAPALIEMTGCDGVVFKDSMYGPWAKLKHRKTIDCVVTGWREGDDEGRHADRVGSLLCSVYDNSLGTMKLVEIAAASGMSDTVRYAI